MNNKSPTKFVTVVIFFLIHVKNIQVPEYFVYKITLFQLQKLHKVK